MLGEKASGGVSGWGTRLGRDSLGCDRTGAQIRAHWGASRAKMARYGLALALWVLLPWGGAIAAGGTGGAAGPAVRAIHRANKALARKDYSTAEALLQSLHKRYPGNGEVLALLVRSDCEQGRYASAKRLYAGIPVRRRQSELKTAVGRCRHRREFEQAREALAHGHPGHALAIATPLYAADVNRYRAGLIVASAYMRLGRIAKAAGIYESLHRRYPGDSELGNEARRLREIEAISTAKKIFSQGNTRAAIAEVKPVYDNPRSIYRLDAGALLASAYSAQGDTVRALKVYRALLASHPGDPALSKPYARVRTKALIERANALIAHKSYAEAISLLKPHYQASSPNYAIGMALASAYRRSGKPGTAASVYRALQRTYPDDHELPELRLRTLLAARRYPAAVRLYNALDSGREKAVAASLGYEARRLYLYSASVGAQLVKDSNGYPNEQLYELRLKAVTRAGTFVGHIQNEHRFNLSAENYRLDYYYRLSQGWYGYLSYAHSPDHSFLAKNDYTLSLDKVIGPVTVMGSFRHLAFTQSSAAVYFAGLGFYPASRLQLIAGAFYVPQTSGYSLMLEPVWYLGNGEAYAYFTAGQIGEQLNVSGGVKRTASYSIRLGRRLDITPRFGISMEAFYEHRSSLYNRTGLGLYLTWRW